MALMNEDTRRANPDACAEALAQCEERRVDFSYTRIRLISATIASSAGVLPANSQAVGFSYAREESMAAAFGGDPTNSAAAATAAGPATGSDTDLISSRESDGDLLIDSFGLLPLPNSDGELLRRVMAECHLDIAFDGNTVKRMHALLAPGGGGLVGALESLSGASGAAVQVGVGGSNGVPRPQAVFSFGGAPLIWRGGGPIGQGVYDKLTVTVKVPRAISVPTGGSGTLLFDALLVARGVRVKGVRLART